MQQLPYGLPKLMVSTCAAGDTSAFVGIKDIMMMFSVSDILGLNPFMRKVLANAAGAACGMAKIDDDKVAASNKPLIGMSNLGVLTNGAEFAVEYLESKGYEVIMFHAVGAGGRAMEQMMREGPHHRRLRLRHGRNQRRAAPRPPRGRPGPADRRRQARPAAGASVPGGSEHIGLFLSEANVLPEKYKNHMNTFHSPIIAAPRLNPDELVEVGQGNRQAAAAHQGRRRLHAPAARHQPLRRRRRPAAQPRERQDATTPRSRRACRRRSKWSKTTSAPKTPRSSTNAATASSA